MDIDIRRFLTEEQEAKLADAAFDNLPYLVIGGGAFLIGSFLVIDDIADFGKFNFGWNPLWQKEHPTWFHHWQWGVLLVIIGLMVLGVGIWRVLQDIGWKPSQVV